MVGMLLALVAAPPAGAAVVSQDARFTASDGVSLQLTVSGEGPLTARPTVVEFSPYGRGSTTLSPGPAYNVLLVQIRGTGDSDGGFDALGPRTQADVAEVLGWACEQPFSDGRLALNGFSASAITIYNSLHRELPCVKAAVLKSGTFELYRDLLYPGGINNIVPGAVVLAGIGGISLSQGLERLERNPLSAIDVLRGLNESGFNDLLHPTLDDWWRERGFRGDVNDLPILMIDGFFDVESRGAFQAFQELRGDGAHLVVIGAHDGAPAGTDAGVGEARAWLDHHVLGADNGIEDEPAVKLWLADGDREGLLDGRFARVDATDWPVPGTRWESLPLGGGGTLGAPAKAATESYPALPSPPTSSDQPNVATVGVSGPITQMGTVEKLGLAYTTRPFSADVLSAGPASLEVRLSSTAQETGIWAVISDVAPDGTANPVATGRLNSAFPEIDRSKSLADPVTGDVVQPYGRFDRKTPALPGSERLYRVEFWPIGNRFKRGHRLRLHILGQSLASLPGVPAVNTVRVGGSSGSRLLVPVLPGSNLRKATSARCPAKRRSHCRARRSRARGG
jgi:hypothetical protein